MCELPTIFIYLAGITGLILVAIFCIFGVLKEIAKAENAPMLIRVIFGGMAISIATACILLIFFSISYLPNLIH